ncbi:MAG: hypothetical protein LBG43_06560 [Treponema sp.]|jgi:hypothetical protein|nr:hypothetical protein [Treponema sp.]
MNVMKQYDGKFKKGASLPTAAENFLDAAKSAWRRINDSQRPERMDSRSA